MCCKGPAAIFERTFKGLFSIMNAHVRFQIALFGELLVAALIRTDERFQATLKRILMLEFDCN